MIDYRDAVNTLVKAARSGRPIVPLVGAGISVESGAPTLSELTRYLAKTKAYLRYRVFENRPAADSNEQIRVSSLLSGKLTPLSRQRQPREYLREFGWPDPQELTSNLWHRLVHDLANDKIDRPGDLPRAMDLLVNAEIISALGQLDTTLSTSLSRQLRSHFKSSNQNVNWQLKGSLWKILLTQLTRSSPDLVDTLFQRLTSNRQPTTAHRFLAFLTPVLRLRLFLTINFDSLLEDGLRLEGLSPTIYEVADGLSLPHPKLVQENLSIVKLHGGAYGLLVGDRLDSPLDEETRSRFRSYLPENLLLTVLGIGGWDQRIIDMVDLAKERGGDVLWLHFESEPPDPLARRFAQKHLGQLPKWLMTSRVQDPGAFLRDVYTTFKIAHPSSAQPYQPCDLRPVSPSGVALSEPFKGAAMVARLVVFEDASTEYGLGASLRLAKFVTARSATHLPVWIDLETKFTVDDLLVDIIQQLRRYDPGLPPEIIALARSYSHSADFAKISRRIYWALGRGRYLLAFNGLQSFGRSPLCHHAYYSKELRVAQRRHMEALRHFFECLLNGLEPKKVEGLGLMDSVLAFSIDHPDWVLTPELANLVRGVADSKGYLELLESRISEAPKPDSGLSRPCLALLATIRRRRSPVSLDRLGSKYIDLKAFEGPGRDEKAPATLEEVLREVLLKGWIVQLEGGDYWMGRRVRNKIYDGMRFAADGKSGREKQVAALFLLAHIHQDLAEYHHREVFVGSQDVTSLLEEIYHRVSALRHLARLSDVTARDSAVNGVIQEWQGTLTGGDANGVAGRHILPQRDSRGRHSNLWSHLEPLIKNGRVQQRAIAQRRLWSLRALSELVSQERQTLLARVSGITLAGWVRAGREELEAAIGHARPKPERSAVELPVMTRLAGILEDIEVEVQRDNLRAREILACRGKRLRALVGSAKRKAHSPTSPSTHPNIELQWGRSETGDYDPEPSFLQLRKMTNSGGGGEVSDELWALRKEVVVALGDVWQSSLRAGWAYKEAEGNGRSCGRAIEALLVDWRRGYLDFEGGGAGRSSRIQAPDSYWDLRLQYLQMAGDQELWPLNPIDLKGRSKCIKQHQAAGNALQYCDEALHILDALHERDRVQRSHIYSLKGLAHCFLSEFDAAYRNFDLARAGLSGDSSGQCAVLGLTLMRQAECLMVHADESLTRDWLFPIVRANIIGAEVKWGRLAALEVVHDPRRSNAVLEQDDFLSTGCIRPEFLDVFEGEAHEAVVPGEEGSSLTDVLCAMRSRLAAAGDLLNRAEQLLDQSRRRVDWWSYLFQLRAQLSVEQLLLLLSGDFPKGHIVVERDEGADGHQSRREPDWEKIKHWIVQVSSGANLSPGEYGLRAPSNPFEEDSDFRRHFIHSFQNLLVAGVTAVRQGLDILMPEEKERTDARLLADRELTRLLAIWTKLMVCGACASEMSRRVRVDQNPDENLGEVLGDQEHKERWSQWEFLNGQSGFLFLPKCEALEKWFVERRWGSGRTAQPSVASRARAIARMNLALSKSGFNFPQGTVPGGRAVFLLVKHLAKRRYAAKSVPGKSDSTV